MRKDPIPSKEIEALELIALLRDQPTKGFLLLLERYERLIRHVVKHFSRGKEDREDLYQEVLVKLLDDGSRRLLKWDPNRAAFCSYLYLVSWRICQNCRKRIDRQLGLRIVLPHGIAMAAEYEDSLQVMGQEDSPRRHTALKQAVEQLQTCFEILFEAGVARKEDWILVALRAEGHSAKMVSELLDLSEDTIYQRYHRLRNRLRQCLATHGYQSMADLLSDSNSHQGIINRGVIRREARDEPETRR